MDLQYLHLLSTNSIMLYKSFLQATSSSVMLHSVVVMSASASPDMVSYKSLTVTNTLNAFVFEIMAWTTNRLRSIQQ